MKNSISQLSQSGLASIEAQKQVIREVFVCTKSEVKAGNSLDKALEEDLGLSGIKTKIYVRYLVDGLTDQEYEKALPTIFGELPVEDIMDRDALTNDHNFSSYINKESLPGQYDSTIDAVQQCLMLQTGQKDHNVRAFSTIIFENKISDEDMKKVEKYLINPVDSHTTHLDDTTLLRELPSPENVKTLDGFRKLDDKGLQALIKQYGLAMNLDDIQFAQTYFAKKGIDPTVAEIKVLDTYRSDHCRHTTFTTELKHVTFEHSDNEMSDNAKSLIKEITDVQNEYESARKQLGREEKSNTLMELATIGTRYLKHHTEDYPNIKNIVESDEINACTFRTTIELEDGSSEEREILFKNETHNHPTEIEPFGGAATCLGGCIRDPMSGRSWVFQAMRVTGAADPTQPISETIAGKLPQKVISQIAALGYASYGNQMGIHAGEVREYFHPGYVAKRFEVGYVIAGAPASNIRREEPTTGDKVIMIGGKTGRDGIGGATGSSKEHDSGSVENFGAEVQKGNPVEERKLARLFLDPRFTQYVKKCNDFGAGGVSVAIGELTRGLTIDLDKVPTKYSGLDATELAISESQERMAIVIGPNDYEAVMDIIREYNLRGTDVATVNNDMKNTENDRLIMNRRGKNIVDLDRDFLDMAGAKRTMDFIQINVDDTINASDTLPSDTKKVLEKYDFDTAYYTTLQRKDVASQKGLGSIFDNSVGAGNVLAMYGGQYQETPQIGMVSKIPTFDGVDAKTVTISTHGYNPDIASKSAYLGAINAIKLAVSKNVALGGDYKTMRLSLQEYFGKLKDDPKRWGECYSALLGAFKAQKELGIPAIGGKDSMSGTYKTKEGNEINVPPAVVAFGANMGNIDHIVSSEFKGVGNKVYYFPASKNRDEYRRMLEKVQNLITNHYVHSANVVEAGGLATTIAKMSFGNKIGFETSKFMEDENWFREDLGGIVVEMDLSFDEHSPYLLGKTVNINQIQEDTCSSCTRGLNIKTKEDMEKSLHAYTGTFEKIFPTSGGGNKEYEIPSSPKAKTRHEIIQTGESGLVYNFDIVKGIKPKILIPVFPGSNSELDTAHAARKAGLQAQEFIFNNQTPDLLIQSTKKFAELLKDTQMVTFPGGFSAGDQPHGSAKFIASIFRMNLMRDAMQNYLDKPDTLTLGICNGFQALIKLGVFDEGKIKEYLGESDPTLFYNTTGRHMTEQVGLNIISVLSPMLSLVDIGDTFVIPISHGEGRIYMKDDTTLEKYIKNGQVVMQYLDHEGMPTSEFNGSLLGIAALCSPDGRILGMMPHPERSGEKLFQNIPGNHDLPIFRSAATSFGVK